MPMVTNPHGRITGIDVARALAIVGMVMAHVQPRGLGEQSDLLAIAYRSVNGRAAILFGLLAGVGISLLDGRSLGHRRTVTTMVWRAVVLFPMGFWLQSLDTPVAVILHYYAFFFLLGAVLVHLSDRGLLVVAGVALLAGPAVVQQAVSAVDAARTMPDWWDVGATLRTVTVLGYYPIVTWAVPLSVGMWLGRRRLDGRGVAGTMVVGGAVAITAGYLASIAFRPRVSGELLGQLFEIEPHNQMPLWLVTATGTAVAVLGLALIVGERLPRLTAPFAAAGRMAFTIYVAHLLVFDLRPEWLGPNTSFPDAAATVARFVVVTLVVSTVWVRLIGTGPLESLLRMPRIWGAGPGPHETVPGDRVRHRP